MKGILKIEHIRGSEVLGVQEVSNMCTDVFNKMVYDLFYASDSTVYNASSMLYYDVYNNRLTLPRLAMYLSSGVIEDSKASHPSGVIGMTSGLNGATVCGDNYLVGIGAGSSGGLTISAEFGDVEGAVRSVGLCIPSDNNYNCNRSNRLYSKELGLVLNNDDYIRYHSGGYYSNIVKLGNKVVFLHIDAEVEFGTSKYGGTYLYEITEEGTLSVLQSYGTLAGVTPLGIANINRVSLVPNSGGYTLLVYGKYKDSSNREVSEVMKIEFDADMLLTGRVLRTGLLVGSGITNQKEYTAQVVKTMGISEGLGYNYTLFVNSRGELVVGKAGEDVINPIVGGTQTSLGTDTVKITSKLSDSDAFDLFNGTYTADGEYRTLSGVIIDLESVYSSGVLPQLSLGDVDYLVSRGKIGDYTYGIIHPNNPFMDKNINMIKDSINVSVDKPRLIFGKERSLLTNAKTDGVINMKKGDTLRVSYSILV